MNIVDPILFQGRLNPPAAALCVPGTTSNLISYGRLGHLIDSIGRILLSEGLAPRQVAAVSVKDTVFHAAIALALMRLGIATVSIREPHLPKGLRLDAVIADSSQPFGDRRVIVADPAWTTGEYIPLGSDDLPTTDEDDPCRIILTSGTTGEPKAIAFTHRMLFERLNRFHYAFGGRFPSARRLYSDLGLATATGFRSMLFTLWRGGTMFFHGDRPEATVQSFELYGVQGMVAGPFGLAEYLKFYEARPAFQSSFDHIVCLGGQTSKSLSERVRARMCANLFCAYGATEVSTVAVAPAHAIADVPGAVGYVLPDMTVEVVDADERALGYGKEGRIRVSSRYNVAGYMEDEPASSKSFRKGWFYPGDIGYLTEDRLLVITGRESAVLNLGGDKVSAERVERAIASFPGVIEVAAFTVADSMGIDQLHAAVVSTGFDAAALRAHCRRQLPADFVPVEFRAVPALPRNQAGKVDRRRLAAGS